MQYLTRAVRSDVSRAHREGAQLGELLREDTFPRPPRPPLVFLIAIRAKLAPREPGSAVSRTRRLWPTELTSADMCTRSIQNGWPVHPRASERLAVHQDTTHAAAPPERGRCSCCVVEGVQQPAPARRCPHQTRHHQERCHSRSPFGGRCLDKCSPCLSQSFL